MNYYNFINITFNEYATETANRNCVMLMNFIEGDKMIKKSASLEIQNHQVDFRYGIGKQSKKAKKLDRRRRKTGMMIINCHEKYCYSTSIDAQIASDEYNYRIAFMEFPMVPYFCSVHDTWHKGHNQKLNKLQAEEYLLKSRDRHSSWTNKRF